MLEKFVKEYIEETKATMPMAERTQDFGKWQDVNA